MTKIISQLNSKANLDLPVDVQKSRQTSQIYENIRVFGRMFWQFSLYYGEYIARTPSSSTRLVDQAPQKRSF